MKLLSVKKAANYLNCDISHVYYLIRMSRIEAIKIRFMWRLVPDSVREYDNSRNQKTINDNTPIDLGRAGRLQDPFGFIADNMAGNQGRETQSIPTGRRMEYIERGLSEVPVKKRKSVKPYSLFDSVA